MALEFALESSPGLASWLAGQNCSLIVSGYQSGQVFIIGTDPEGKLQLTATRFDRAMGLCHGRRGLWMASLSQLTHFVPVRSGDGKEAEHDAFLVPQCTIHTGYVNAHEVAVDAAGRPLVAASFFNCVLAVDPMRGSRPVWAPPSIKTLDAADICHVNGLCLDQGKLRFATALAAGGETDGWRQRHDGGVIFDCPTGKVVASNLVRPHSPRLHDSKLWLLNSGAGTIGVVKSGRFAEMTLCPGYPRGLAFLDSAAIIGVSRLRSNGSGADLPLAQRLRKKEVSARCGVVILDTTTGKPLHEAYFGEGIDEIFDVAVLSGLRNPKLLKPGTREAARSYLFDKPSPRTRTRPQARLVKQTRVEH